MFPNKLFVHAFLYTTLYIPQVSIPKFSTISLDAFRAFKSNLQMEVEKTANKKSFLELTEATKKIWGLRFGANLISLYFRPYYGLSPLLPFFTLSGGRRYLKVGAEGPKTFINHSTRGNFQTDKQRSRGRACPRRQTEKSQPRRSGQENPNIGSELVIVTKSPIGFAD